MSCGRPLVIFIHHPLLKQIPVSQLRLGMHLHKLQGSWLAHSIWRSRFLIHTAEELRQLHACGVAACLIDTSLGADVETAIPDAGAESGAEGGAEQNSQAAVTTVAAVATVAARPQPASLRPMAEELEQAAAICRSGQTAVLALFAEARLGRTVQVEGCLPLVAEIADSVHRNPNALVSLARLKSRDNYSYMHSVAVCALMVSLARQIGLSPTVCREAGLAGLMHDIGKAVMPAEVLNKPGPLTDAEFSIMRSHPERGHALLIGGPGATTATLDVVLHHHERFDGTGYPHRLAGEQITQMARMGAICDVYDAITSVRPYKDGWDPAESIARMAAWQGHFDSALFGAFVQTIGIYPIGSLVKLASGRLAVVMEQNPIHLTAPVVKVFFSTQSKLPLEPRRLDLAGAGCNDRIVGRGERSGCPDLDALWADPEVLRRVRH